MASEKQIEKAMEAKDKNLKLEGSSTDSVKQDMGSEGNGLSQSQSSKSVPGDVTSSIKECITAQPLGAEQGVNLLPDGSYYYPGFDGTYPEWDNQKSYTLSGDGLEVPYSGIQSDNGSVVYYMPGYNPYTSGTLTGVDSQSVGQHAYFPSEYFQPSSSYGSEIAPSYYCDSTTNAGVFHSSDAIPVDPKPSISSPISLKSRESNNIKTEKTVDNKVSTRLSDSKSHVSTSSSRFSNSSRCGQPLKPPSKVPQKGSNFQSSGLLKGQHPAGKIPSFPNQGHGGLFPQYRFSNSGSNGQAWVGNDRFKMREKFNRNEAFEASSEMSRGPRARRVKDPVSLSTDKVQLSSMIRRDQYNLKDFKTKYEQAMFFVIKSYSEADVHKSIKYNVWSSTPKGNEKLDAAFHDAERKSNEKGMACPIFLFFSVNKSGQFIGLAEMIGQVDFKKSMDFWQEDKWNGFFPVKWHIIKDISHREFQHIIVEDNDHKAVTHSRDTQEIKLSQGLQMLNIFKSSLAKTSILDDFSFYEDQAKSKGSRHPLPPLGINSNTKSPVTKNLEAIGRNVKESTRAKNLETIERNVKESTRAKNLEAIGRNVEESTRVKKNYSVVKPSLVTLTRNLSLYPHPTKEGEPSKDSTADRH
ncbi:hypothetical protein AAC387_Pa04g2393 [Persea americana]